MSSSLTEVCFYWSYKWNSILPYSHWCDDLSEENSHRVCHYCSQIYTPEVKTYYQTWYYILLNHCFSPVFIFCFFTVNRSPICNSPNREQSKCSLMGKCVNKPWYIHIQWTTSQQWKSNEQIIGTWKKLDVSQRHY